MTMPLLKPVRLGALELPNRVLMAPMTRARANPGDLVPTELMARYYAQRATAGLIVSEGTWVSEDAIGFHGVPGLFTDAQVLGWRRVTEAVHEAGGRIFAQLGHIGARSHPSHPRERPPAGPATLSARGVATTIAAYRAAAENARRAGFDGVEVHAQGSHLIPQFLNPRTNPRTDAYGGTPEARGRFLFDVLDTIAGAWEPGRLAVKLSPRWVEEPLFTGDEEILTDYEGWVKQLGGTGLAYLTLVGDSTRYRPLYPGELVANGGFTRETGNAIIHSGLADAVSFGTPFIANPDLVARFAAGHPLSGSDPATHYGGDSAGYTDYPHHGGQP